MGSTRKRRTYTPEYRREAAHLVIDTDRTIATVAGEINVGAQLLGRWVQQERDRIGAPPEAPLDASEPVSYTHLRAHETVLDLVCRLLLEKKKVSQLLTTSKHI